MLWGLVQIAESEAWSGLPMSPVAVRTLVIVVAVLLAAHLLARGRDQLASRERHVPELLVGAGHVLLALWFTQEAWATARAFEGPGGAWQGPPSIERQTMPSDIRRVSRGGGCDSSYWPLRWPSARHVTVPEPRAAVNTSQAIPAVVSRPRIVGLVRRCQ